MAARILTSLDNIVYGLLLQIGMKLAIDAGDGHGHDDANNGAPDHDLDERERDAKAICLAQGHPRLMLLVMANMADKMLNNNPPTPTAMMMIITGSMRL